MSYRNDPYDPKQAALLDQAALDDAVSQAEKAFAERCRAAAEHERQQALEMEKVKFRPKFEALDARLGKVVQENAGVGIRRADVELILMPDATTEWEKLAPVYAAALRAKFEKIGFAPAR